MRKGGARVGGWRDEGGVGCIAMYSLYCKSQTGKSTANQVSSNLPPS